MLIDDKDKSYKWIRRVKNIFKIISQKKFSKNWIIFLILLWPSWEGSIKIAKDNIQKLPDKTYLTITKSYPIEFYKAGFNKNLPINFIKGFLSSPEIVKIDIKFDEYQKLVEKRKEALDRGILITGDDDFVKATIRHKDNKYDAKLRLKGDFLDHIVNDQWSFRVKMSKTDYLFGMSKFSLQAPRTRNYIYEYIYHQLLRNEGIPSLRYKFIRLSINGKDLGIYALEEHFTKVMLENNFLREGPILKFSESAKWDKPIYTRAMGEEEFYQSKIEGFQRNRLTKNENLNPQYRKSEYLMKNYINGNYKTNQVFDINSLAKFFALVDLTGGTHNTVWHNMRFYYNPVLGKFMPIGFDALIGRKLNALGIEYNPLNFFEDELFIKKYVQELERVSERLFINNFLNEYEDKITKNLNILYKSYPYINFRDDFLEYNQNLIKKKLDISSGLEIYLNQITDNDIKISFLNKQLFPVKIISLEAPNINITKPSYDIIPAKKAHFSANIENYSFQYSKQNKEKLDYSNLMIKYKIIGSNKIYIKKIEDKFKPPILSNYNEYLRAKSNYKNFKFIEEYNEKKLLKIKKGNWIIDRPLIIQNSFDLIIDAGTNIKLTNDGMIFSNGSLNLNGSNKSPIKFLGTNGNQGITIINAPKKSTINYAVFDGLSAPNNNEISIMGGLNFYESAIHIGNSEFKNNNSEDSINIIRSNLKIINSSFSNTKSDALDIDFGEGKLVNLRFDNIGNDGIDLSGSKIEIKDINISKAYDKGISVGENSILKGVGITIKESKVGIASKDNSSVFIDTASLSNNIIDFEVYQKKPEFAPSSLILKNTYNDGKLFLKYKLEKFSTLSINNNQYYPNVNNYYQKINSPITK